MDNSKKGLKLSTLRGVVYSVGELCSAPVVRVEFGAVDVLPSLSA